MENSAERLVDILTKARRSDKNATGLAVWKSIFNLSELTHVPDKLGAIFILTNNVAREMLSEDPESSAARHIRECMLRICRTDPGAPWSETSKHIDDHMISYLKMHAQISRITIPVKSIKMADFEKAYEYLSSAIIEIKSSDLSSQIKYSLISRIRNILIAIENFQITGQEAVFDALKLALLDHKDELSKDDLPGKSNLKEGISLIADLLQISTTAHSLSAPVRQMIDSISTLKLT